eukprot:155061-Rhodomonas_salina.1
MLESSSFAEAAPSFRTVAQKVLEALSNPRRPVRLLAHPDLPLRPRSSSSSSFLFFTLKHDHASVCKLEVR